MITRMSIAKKTQSCHSCAIHRNGVSNRCSASVFSRFHRAIQILVHQSLHILRSWQQTAKRERFPSQAVTTSEAITWWAELTSAGNEGIVVKPLNFVSKERRGSAQPAIKCRGPEFLHHRWPERFFTYRNQVTCWLHSPPSSFLTR